MNPKIHRLLWIILSAAHETYTTQELNRRKTFASVIIGIVEYCESHPPDKMHGLLQLAFGGKTPEEVCAHATSAACVLELASIEDSRFKKHRLVQKQVDEILLGVENAVLELLGLPPQLPAPGSSPIEHLFADARGPRLAFVNGNPV